jgi:hypothetical protein
LRIKRDNARAIAARNLAGSRIATPYQPAEIVIAFLSWTKARLTEAAF